MAYEDANRKLDWALSFQRTGQIPLDRSSIFASYEDALAYAKQDGSDSRELGGSAYVGQIIVNYGPGPENESGEATEEITAYIITEVGETAKIEKLTATDASGDLPADIEKIKEALEKLSAELKTRIYALETTVGDASSGLVKAVNDVTAAHNTLAEKVDSNFNSISSRLSTDEADIAANKGNIETNTANIAENKTSIAANTAGITTLQSDLNTTNTNVTNLTTRVTTAESDIDALEETVKSLSGAFQYKGTFDTLPAAENYEQGNVVIVGAQEYVLIIKDEAKSWVEFGDEGSYLLKSVAESDYLKKVDAASTYVPQTRTINSKDLSGDITLTAADIGIDVDIDQLKIDIDELKKEILEKITEETLNTAISAAIGDLDVEEQTLSADQTVKSISETDGKISVEVQDISLTHDHISDWTTAMSGYQTSIDVSGTGLLKQTESTDTSGTVTKAWSIDASDYQTKDEVTSAITAAVSELDTATVEIGASNTLASIGEADGKLTVGNVVPISILHTAVSDWDSAISAGTIDVDGSGLLRQTETTIGETTTKSWSIDSTEYQTESDVAAAISTAISSLDSGTITVGVTKTLTGLWQTDGLLHAAVENIAIPHTQITDWATALEEYVPIISLTGEGVVVQTVDSEGNKTLSVSDAYATKENVTYQISSALDDISSKYLLSSTAASTYLTIADAADTYAEKDYVSANPSSTTATLSGISINGTAYSIDGSEVIANPDASPTSTLNKVTINNVTYQIVGSSSSNMTKVTETFTTETSYTLLLDSYYNITYNIPGTSVSWTEDYDLILTPATSTDSYVHEIAGKITTSSAVDTVTIQFKNVEMMNDVTFLPGRTYLFSIVDTNCVVWESYRDLAVNTETEEGTS